MSLFAPADTPVSPVHKVLTLTAVLLILWGCTVKVRTPLSVGIIALGVLVVVRVDLRAPFIHLWRGAGQALRGYLRRPDYWLPGLLFMGYLLSALWSKDADFLSSKLMLSAQAVGIPVAIWVLAPVLRPWRRRLLIAFGVMTSLGAAAVLLYLSANTNALLVALGKGKSIPMPHSHVYFTYTLSLAAVASVYYALRREIDERQRRDVWRWAAAASSIVLVVTLHMLAVRTGLMTLYIGLAILGLRLVQPRFGWLGVAGLALAAVVAGAVAVTVIPTLSQKLAYARYDVERLYHPSKATYSDGGRWLSIRVGYDIVAAHPFGGAPSGRLNAEMRRRYAAAGHVGLWHMPHNQYLYTWAAAGLAGLLGVLGATLGPLVVRRFWRKPLLLEFVAMATASCLVAATLEADIGIAATMLMVYLAKLEAPVIGSPPSQVTPT